MKFAENSLNPLEILKELEKSVFSILFFLIFALSGGNPNWADYKCSEYLNMNKYSYYDTEVIFVFPFIDIFQENDKNPTFDAKSFHIYLLSSSRQ